MKASRDLAWLPQPLFLCSRRWGRSLPVAAVFSCEAGRPRIQHAYPVAKEAELRRSQCKLPGPTHNNSTIAVLQG